LGGNRKGKTRTYINIFIVFLVSGIWHGAGWTFVVWGILHGVANILCRLLKTPLDKFPKWFNWICCFVFLNATWVIFRADSLSQALTLFGRLFSGGTTISDELTSALSKRIFFDLLRHLPFTQVTAVYCVVIIVAALLLTVLFKNTQERVSLWKPDKRFLITAVVLLSVSIISLSGVSSFLYFDF
jgi:hypothetical protein